MERVLLRTNNKKISEEKRTLTEAVNCINSLIEAIALPNVSLDELKPSCRQVV